VHLEDVKLQFSLADFDVHVVFGSEVNEIDEVLGVGLLLDLVDDALHLVHHLLALLHNFVADVAADDLHQLESVLHLVEGRQGRAVEVEQEFV